MSETPVLSLSARAGFKKALKLCALCLFLPAENGQALSLEGILRAPNATALKQSLEKAEKTEFLKLLCEGQKREKKPPTACFELKQPADTFCLSLKTTDLDSEILMQALSSPFLSPLCRKRLKEKQKLLLYRKKDRLIPGLR